MAAANPAQPELLIEVQALRTTVLGMETSVANAILNAAAPSDAIVPAPANESKKKKRRTTKTTPTKPDIDPDASVFDKFFT